MESKIEYKCESCGINVLIFKDKEPLKPCKCDAPIIVNVKATVKSTSSLK
jgi:DNA-directed RNA polymerase subunit RPC12/RpoP